MASILYEVVGEFRSVVFDATLKENHSNSGTATEHTVEVGANISDHFRKDRDRLTLEVQVTNHPIVSPGVDGANGAVAPLSLQGSEFEITTGATVSESGNVEPAKRQTTTRTAQANVLQFSQPFDRVAAVRQQLKDLQNNATILTVITSVDQYNQMILEDIQTLREGRDSVDISLEFAELRTAEGQTVDLPEPVETRGERARNRGAQATVEAPPEQASVAAQLLERFTGLGLLHKAGG